ncbi:aminotransferase class IV [Nonomuraea gerenzanensis]|uniref:aminotransferase class IV n=1 Tax=Nonomuraea gerenzanensis TaxID=93944 RepID=UPI001CDA0EE4|nr:aminotransferase class IV [Nonomuraea gerenzanensis]UBU17528.1 aminotransferase class IV [Nonomuraea gerenzanensis]
MTGRTAVDGDLVGAGARLMLEARYGHFTAMQVRGRRVRGLGRHLDRLEAASRELFGAGLDRAAVLASIRAVLGDAGRDAGVRVHVVEYGGRPRIVAAAYPPHPPPAGPLHVKPVVYQRYLPHIKQAFGFQQAHILRQAAREGFDEALLTTADGLISEGAITNLGAFAGGRLVWPDAPMLLGITMSLLRDLDVPQERRPIKVADLSGFDQVFLCNSWGVMPVGRVDGVPLRQDAGLVARLVGHYEGVPADPVD